MKIFSTFHDYYDTAIGYGTDLSRYYQRDSRTFEYRKLKSKLPDSLLVVTNPQRERQGYMVGRQLIGFCGRVYPTIIYQKPGGYTLANLEVPVVRWVSNPTFRIWTALELNKSLIATSLKEKKWTWSRSMSNDAFMSRSGLRITDDIFREIDAPVFLLRAAQDRTESGYYIVTNPTLRDFEFYLMFDAFSAFQEIAMYLGNEMVKEKQPDDVEDKYKITGHGFDFVKSFRRGKQR